MDPGLMVFGARRTNVVVSPATAPEVDNPCHDADLLLGRYDEQACYV